MHQLAKWLIGIGLATIVGLAVWFQTRPVPEPEPVTEVAAAPAAEPVVALAPEPEPKSEPEPQPEPAPAMAPQVDVVRVAPDGQTVIAGRAAPGQTVEILVDGKVIDTVEADATGEFATVTEIALLGEAHVLTLRTLRADAPEITVALAPFADAAKVAAVQAAAAEQAAAEAEAERAATAAEAAAADSAAKLEAAEVATAEAAAAEAEAAAATVMAAAAQTVAIEPSAEPAATEAATTEPATTEPATTEPATTEPATTEAATTEAAEAEAAKAAAAEAAAAKAVAAAQAAAAKAAAAEAAAAEAAVAAAAAQAAAEAATAEAVTAKAATDAAAASAEPEVSRFAVSAPVIILPPEGAEQAPLLVKPESGGVTLLQPAAAEPAAGIVLDRITYSEQGDLVAAGRGRPGSIVRIYANAVFLEEIRCDDDGEWQIKIASHIATSALLLRFDEVDDNGLVLSRVETPFEYSPLVTAHELHDRKIVVQKGDYLWKFAEQHYGAGWRYSVIFSANADLIRDPDLIYPGQIFTVPELVNRQ